MTKRISIKDIEPNAYKAMLELEKYTKTADISISLRELIKIRASQINGCSYCVDMHTEDAIKLGESGLNLVAGPQVSFLMSTKNKFDTSFGKYAGLYRYCASYRSKHAIIGNGWFSFNYDVYSNWNCSKHCA